LIGSKDGLYTDANGRLDYLFKHPHNGSMENYRLFVRAGGPQCDANAAILGTCDYKQLLYLTKREIQVALAADWGGAIYELWSYPTTKGFNLIDHIDTGALFQASIYECQPRDAAGNLLLDSTGRVLDGHSAACDASVTNPAQAGSYNRAANVIVKNPVDWTYEVVNTSGGQAVQLKIVSNGGNVPMLDYAHGGAATHFKMEQIITMPTDNSAYFDIQYKIHHIGDDVHWLQESELPSIYLPDVSGGLKPRFRGYLSHAYTREGDGVTIAAIEGHQNPVVAQGDLSIHLTLRKLSQNSDFKLVNGRPKIKSCHLPQDRHLTECLSENPASPTYYLSPVTSDQGIVGSGDKIIFDRTFRVRTDWNWAAQNCNQRTPTNASDFSGTHNTVGLSNGDSRFLCLDRRWHDCGWEGNDPTWSSKVPDGKAIGGWLCSQGTWSR